MTKIIIFLFLALIVLGFMFSNTFNLLEDMATLREQNLELKQEVQNLRSTLDETSKEKETLRNENNTLKQKIVTLEQRIQGESQARTKAENNISFLLAYIGDRQDQFASTATCQSAENQDVSTNNFQIGSILPITGGVGALGLFGILLYTNYSKKFSFIRSQNLNKE